MRILFTIFAITIMCCLCGCDREKDKARIIIKNSVGITLVDEVFTVINVSERSIYLKSKLYDCYLKDENNNAN